MLVGELKQGCMTDELIVANESARRDVEKAAIRLAPCARLDRSGQTRG